MGKGAVVPQSDNAGDGIAVTDEMDPTAGRFVASAQDASSAVPLLVGKIQESNRYSLYVLLSIDSSESAGRRRIRAPP